MTKKFLNKDNKNLMHKDNKKLLNKEIIFEKSFSMLWLIALHLFFLFLSINHYYLCFVTIILLNIVGKSCIRYR